MGFDMSSEIEIAVDWTAFFLNLGIVVAQGFASVYGQVDGASNAVSALVSAASSIKVDSSLGQRAWSLFSLSFAWAFDELRFIGDLNEDNDEKSIKAAFHKIRLNIKNEKSFVLSKDFLFAPTSFTLYQVAREAFIREKTSFRPGLGEADAALRAKFDAAFNRAVFEVWSRNESIFQPIQSALNSPGGEASSFDLQWKAYKASLVYDFEVNPVFGQEQAKVSIAQMYVPLRATWLEDQQSSGIGKPKQVVAHAGKKRRVCSLDQELEKWIFSGATEDSIRLIGGGPGSGKSTTLRALARRLAERADCRPLFIPLQYIDLDGDLREGIADYFVGRTLGAFRQNPLARNFIETGPPLILLFDGLDEIARPGAAANDVVRLFITKLNQLIVGLRGESHRPLRVVVSGRMPSFQAARTFLSVKNQKSLQVIGFLPRVNISGDTIPDKKQQVLASVDQRSLWWERYSAAAGSPIAIPQAMVDTKLQALTDEPLLCYLLVLSGYAVDNWEKAAENRNRIYERLINEVWSRHWGDGGRQGNSRFLTLENFNKLMETIALAAWLGGDTKVATQTGFENALRVMHTEEAWDEFQRDNGADATNLALNFYLKNSEVEKRGFEFTHKSFGDYLAARAILSVGVGLIDLGVRRIEAAAEEWLKATSGSAFNYDIFQFVRDDVRLWISQQAVSQVISLKKYFEHLANYAVKEGLPVYRHFQEPWRLLDVRQNNSESAIWALLNSAVLALSEHSPEFARINIDWGDNYALAHLLERLSKRPRPKRTREGP